MTMSQQTSPKMDLFYQMKYDDARATSRKLRANGEYIWADHWEKYAKLIATAEADYKESCRKVAFLREAMKKAVPDPIPILPLQPANLTFTEKDGVKLMLQCTYRYNDKANNGYRRPAELQGIRM